MARPPRNPMAMKQLTACLKKLDKRQPGAAPKQIERWILRNLDIEVGDETIRRAFAGEVDPTSCQVELLVGLAAFYAAEPDELGHIAASRITPLLTYAATVSPPEGGPGLPVARSRWTASDSLVKLPARARDERCTVVPLPIAA